MHVQGKRTRRRPASARPPSPARVDTHWDTTPGRRGTTAFTARVIGEAQGGDLLTRDGFRKNQRRTPEPAVVFGPPEWRPTRRRFKNKAEMKASVERLTRSAAHMRLDNYMDLHERQAGFGRADRPATARYGGGREETGGGGRMRPGTAPPGGFSHLQAAGRLYPFGGQTRRLSSYEQDLVSGTAWGRVMGESWRRRGRPLVGCREPLLAIFGSAWSEHARGTNEAPSMSV